MTTKAKQKRRRRRGGPVFRPYFTDKSGKRRWARDYGLKAWPFRRK